MERENSGWGSPTHTSGAAVLCQTPSGARERTEHWVVVHLQVATRKRNSPHKSEGDAEVIVADAVIATILLEGKLPEKKKQERKKEYEERKGKNEMM